jgi:putative ATPase
LVAAFIGGHPFLRRITCGYAYDHSEDEAFSGQNYFPDGMQRQNFYAPTSYGYERELKERLDRFAELRKQRSKR